MIRIKASLRVFALGGRLETNTNDPRATALRRLTRKVVIETNITSECERENGWLD